jgi:hypothetical protein
MGRTCLRYATGIGPTEAFTFAIGLSTRTVYAVRIRKNTQAIDLRALEVIPMHQQNPVTSASRLRSALPVSSSGYRFSWGRRERLGLFPLRFVKLTALLPEEEVCTTRPYQKPRATRPFRRHIFCCCTGTCARRLSSAFQRRPNMATYELNASKGVLALIVSIAAPQ